MQKQKKQKVKTQKVKTQKVKTQKVKTQSLAITHPELDSQWCPTKNTKLLPYDGL